MTTGLRTDGDRLLRRIGELATIGPIEGGGSCRLALTEEDRLGRDLVVAWMRGLDLDVTIDGIGNVVAVRPGRLEGPPTMTGSHIDTVRTGGRYDGNLGVLAGLEVIETLAENGVETEHPLAVAFFTDEEGSRFPPDMLGSLVYVEGLGHLRHRWCSSRRRTRADRLPGHRPMSRPGPPGLRRTPYRAGSGSRS